MSARSQDIVGTHQGCFFARTD